MIVAALISYPQAIVLGLLQGVSELFPVSSLGHSVILPEAPRLGHPPERQVLPHLPRRDPSGDRDRPVPLLLARLAADLQGPGTVAARPGDLRGRPGRETRLAARRRDDPGRDPRPDPRAFAAQGLRLPDLGRGLSDAQRAAALRRRAAAPACAGHRGRGRRTDRPDGLVARLVLRRRRAGDRADPRLLSLRRDDGRRPLRRSLAQGCGALCVPAGNADHRCRGAAQGSRAVRVDRRRRARPGARRRLVLGGDGVSRRQVPDALLRDEHADAVRDLLLRSRPRVHRLGFLSRKGVRERWPSG